MDNNKNIDDVKLTVKKGSKTSKGKSNNSKKGKKGKNKKVQLNKTNNIEPDKKEENKSNNEKIKIVEQKETEKKEVKINKKLNIKKLNVVNSLNNELNMKIKEKEEKIKELVISQENNKKILLELFKKVSTTIESNAEVLYSEQKDNKINDEKINKLLKLNELLEKKKIESNKVKEINKKFKNKYENIIKDINTPSVEKFEILQKRINALKENNSILSREIKAIRHKNNLDKISSLNSKNKVNDIKIFSDEYLSLTNEKYRHFCMLKNTKKLIKDAILQFQGLTKMINEKNSLITNHDLDKEIINLKEVLSGDEESIYNRIINNKTIININDNNIIKKLRNSDSAKQIDKIISRAKKLHLKSKNMIKSRSSLNMTNFTKNENDYIDNNQINIKKKDLNLNEYECDNNNIDYKTISNNDFEKILIKKQKYLNFAEKLDKSINDTSIFYENKIKEINNLLEMNSKRLSNVQQENELLKSEIADMRRILELNKKENKIKNRNNFDKKFEKVIKKLEMYKNENSSEIEVNTSKNIEKDSYIEMIKKKYKPKNKSKLLLIQKEVIPNNRSYY